MDFDNSGPELLGPTRLNTRRIKTGWFSSKTVLVHQSLVRVHRMECSGPMVECNSYREWQDTRPEWLLVVENPDHKYTKHETWGDEPEPGTGPYGGWFYESDLKSYGEWNSDIHKDIGFRPKTPPEYR